LVSLDVVRGIAILLVLVFHFRLPVGIAAIDAMVQPLFAVGWIGVDLFFVLSGFLVGGIILRGAAAPAGIDRRTFFARRILRLWPVLWIYLATMLAIGGATAWPMVWPVLLHLQNYGTAAPSHLWSLAVEEHFYLAAIIVIPMLLRRGGHARVEAMLIAIMVVCLGVRLVAQAAGVPSLDLQWQTQYRLDALAFGVLLASTALHRPALFAALTRRWRLALLLSLVGTGTLAVAGDGAFRHGVGFTIAYLSAGAFIVALIDRDIAPAWRWPAHRVASIGLIAYPLYIWHASVGAVVRSIAVPLGIAPAAIIALSVIVAVALAWIMHVLVERPCIALGHALGRARPTQDAPLPATALS